MRKLCGKWVVNALVMVFVVGAPSVVMARKRAAVEVDEKVHAEQRMSDPTLYTRTEAMAGAKTLIDGLRGEAQAQALRKFKEGLAEAVRHGGERRVEAALKENFPDEVEQFMTDVRKMAGPTRSKSPSRGGDERPVKDKSADKPAPAKDQSAPAKDQPAPAKDQPAPAPAPAGGGSVVTDPIYAQGRIHGPDGKKEIDLTLDGLKSAAPVLKSGDATSYSPAWFVKEVAVILKAKGITRPNLKKIITAIIADERGGSREGFSGWDVSEITDTYPPNL